MEDEPGSELIRNLVIYILRFRAFICPVNLLTDVLNV